MEDADVAGWGWQVLVSRFALVFEGHDSELFKLESDELCHAGGIYEMCLLLDNELFGCVWVFSLPQDRRLAADLVVLGISNNDELSSLGKFLRDFTMVFEDDDPKVTMEPTELTAVPDTRVLNWLLSSALRCDSQARWEELFAIHELSLSSFRRDMKRALWRIDDAVNGKTLLEEIFAQEDVERAMPPR